MKLFRFAPHYLTRCGAIDLATPVPPRLQCAQSDLAIRQPARADNDEDAMTRKFPAASKLAILLAAVAFVAAGTSSASAQSKQKYDKDGRPYYGANGPNKSYQQGPRTRVYVTTRSWLDAGTEVLPGDRKFTDYAFPPGNSMIGGVKDVGFINAAGNDYRLAAGSKYRGKGCDVSKFSPELLKYLVK